MKHTITMQTLKSKLPALIMLVALMVTFSACNDDDDPQPAETSVSFGFQHYIDGNPVVFNEIMYTNSFGNEYSVETLKYFLSDIKLTYPDGNEYLIDAEFYIDGTDENTLMPNQYVMIPNGEYSAVSFIYGLSEEKNKPGRFPNAPESNMEWPPAMGTGYHYMKLEGKIDSGGTINNYQAHTGPTMNNQNYFEVELPNSSFTANGNSIRLMIRMNINKWWENPNTLDLNTVTGIMGNQDMQLKLKANGADVFSFGGEDFPLSTQ